MLSSLADVMNLELKEERITRKGMTIKILYAVPHVSQLIILVPSTVGMGVHTVIMHTRISKR